MSVRVENGWSMLGIKALIAICLLFSSINLYSETFRTVVEGSIEVTPERPSGNTISIGINSSVLINLGAEMRFLRGVETPTCFGTMVPSSANIEHKHSKCFICVHVK